MTELIDRPRRPEPSSQRRWWDDGFRPLLLRLHFLIGIFVGPFILLAALTGLLYTLTPAIEQVVHAEQLRVPVGTTEVPLADQVAAGQAAVPEGTLVEVRPPREVNGTTRVVFASPEVDADHTRTAFVDPYTGEVQGVLTTFGEWLPLRAFFDDLHRTMLLGDVGRVYSELAASWLGVLGISGVALWAVRTTRRRWLRRVLLPQRTGSGRSRLRSWHGVVGLWALVGVLFLSLTGLTWSQFAGTNISAVSAQFAWSAPEPQTALPDGAPTAAVPAAEQGVVVALVLDSARTAGLSGPVAITPGDAGEAWTVSQVQRSWPLQQDRVTVDPFTGQVMDRVDFADWPVVAKLVTGGISAHMGLLFGPANVVILAVLALGICCLVVWGYRMWWLRRPTRRADDGEALRLAGVLGRERAPSAVAVGVVAAVGLVLGLTFPVLGASLLLFLAGDQVWQALRARRSERRGVPVG